MLDLFQNICIVSVQIKIYVTLNQNKMKNITEVHHQQISNLLLETADYWIRTISSFSVPSPAWTDFKNSMASFLHYPSLLKTAPESLHPHVLIGLVNYHETGEHVVFGPRIDDFFFVYALAIKINDRELFKAYGKKSDEIHKLIHEKQCEEVEKNFLQAISTYPDVDVVTKDLQHLPISFPTKEWMITLYKASWEQLLKTSTEDFSTCMYSSLYRDNPKIPCVGSDQLIQLLHEPNASGYYTLRFGSFVSGQDFMTVSLGKDDGLKQYADECVNVFSTHLQETMQDTLFALLT